MFAEDKNLTLSREVMYRLGDSIFLMKLSKNQSQKDQLDVLSSREP